MRKNIIITILTLSTALMAAIAYTKHQEAQVNLAKATELQRDEDQAAALSKKVYEESLKALEEAKLRRLEADQQAKEESNN